MAQLADVFNAVSLTGEVCEWCECPIERDEDGNESCECLD